MQGAWLAHQPYLLPTPVLLYEKFSGSNAWILFLIWTNRLARIILTWYGKVNLVGKSHIPHNEYV